MATVTLSGLSLKWYELRCAVVLADRPDDPPPCWVYERGCFVGGCLLSLPTFDNQHNAGGEILVAPTHRRRGVAVVRRPV
jgi:hypothetical protein